jgi:cation transport ATPase
VSPETTGSEVTSSAAAVSAQAAIVTGSPKAAVKLRRLVPIAACLGVAGFLVLAPMGYPLAAALFCAGLVLGLFNIALVQRSAARFAASGNPIKRRFAMSALGRLALITAVAVGLALVLRPQGLAVFAGLAACQLLVIFVASVPLVRELRQSGLEVPRDE